MKNKAKKESNGNFFTKTLQRQILIPFLTLIILAGVSVGYISYTYSVSLTTDELTKNVASKTGVLNDSFATFFDTQEDIVAHYAEQEEFGNYENARDEMMDSLHNIVSSNESIQTAYLGTAGDGEMITSPTLDLPTDYDPRTRPWYEQASENPGEPIWTEPYVDADSGELIVSAAKSVSNNGQMVGVMAIDLNMQAILDIVQNVEIGESGYAAIIDQSGTFVSHPDEARIGEDVSDSSYFQDIQAQENASGTVEYTESGEDRTLGYTNNDRVGWTIIGTINQSELAEKAQPILLPIAITILIVLILSFFLTLVITRKITKPIKSLQGKMKAVEEGDLSVDLTEQRQDEIGQLSLSIDQMKESLRTIIGNVSDATDSVTQQSEQLTQSAREVQEGSEQIASTMEELTSGAETQANGSSNLSEMMGDFVQKVQEAHESGEQISTTSTQVLTMTEEGSALMNKSVDQMKNIEEIVKASVTKVKGLDEQSQEISKLIQVIKDIAEQTNLLSLNAAIEAARAGEHGKGFAVVADEVRKLAEQVSNSVGDITSIVGNIQTESDSVVQSLEEGYQEVDAGSKQIQVTGETFDDIQTSVSEMVGKIKGISEHLKDIADNSSDMNEAIQDIAAVSEESAAGIEQVSASAQQSNSSMEEVSSTASALSELAEQLNQQVNKFKL
ncbi:methyl-accepting chemotaxis protein [Thalassobacillus sp. CUG 92003]|uniref:methyl-accepting chemotaxis protein n=1 Tax=Thalassobacillus sp. CUG 92003 TaxID=2736641 RepID=UPI0015E74C38|nr:methyl-accepting chemotaxis protein [Thalassobacillus sp. CUG 92003]